MENQMVRSNVGNEFMINEIIKSRRIKLSLDEAVISKECGLTIDEYIDIESYPDEIETVTHVREIRCLSRMLNLNIFLELGVNSKFNNNFDLLNINRHILAKEKRIKLGLTKVEFSEKIGFDIDIINKIESDYNFLETWSVELIRELAHQLDEEVELFF